MAMPCVPMTCAYQKFRKIIRNPIILATLKKTPLAFRQKLAQGFRKKSQQAESS